MTYKLTQHVAGHFVDGVFVPSGQTSLIRLSDGAVIPADPDNADYAQYLRWVDAGNTPEPVDTPSTASLVAHVLTEARAQRQPIIGILDGLQASALVASDMTTAGSIEVAKQALRDITKIDLSTCVGYEDMRSAIKARYAEIVTAAPSSVRTAFAGAVA